MFTCFAETSARNDIPQLNNGSHFYISITSLLNPYLGVCQCLILETIILFSFFFFCVYRFSLQNGKKSRSQRGQCWTQVLNLFLFLLDYVRKTPCNCGRHLKFYSICCMQCYITKFCPLQIPKYYHQLEDKQKKRISLEKYD